MPLNLAQRPIFRTIVSPLIVGSCVCSIFTRLRPRATQGAMIGDSFAAWALRRAPAPTTATAVVATRQE